MDSAPPIPITIITGFLGSGKTTLILKLIPQLPRSYRLALIKNEFGDVAVDSQLASAQAIAGVRELLNGCICCNLVGSLGDALEQLRVEQSPDRIVIETSGSAFPATLAMEVNRIARVTGHYTLDGVISVIDVENWKGYDDTSLTAKLQAKFTDLIVLNKWELVSERQLEDCVDRILDIDLEVATPREKSDQGWIDKHALLGLDAKLAKGFEKDSQHSHSHDHNPDHSSEVEVLSITLTSASQTPGIELSKLDELLQTASKDEIYRIKGIIYSVTPPISSDGSHARQLESAGRLGRYILNWAFGRWTFTAIPIDSSTAAQSESRTAQDSVARLTIVTARGESAKWRKRIEQGEYIAVEGDNNKERVEVSRVS